MIKDKALKLVNELIAENKALKAALAQPAQEPEIDLRTRWPMKNWKENKATPQQRPWVGLTDEEVSTLWGEWKDAVCLDYKTWAQAYEAYLKEKNNG